MYMRRNIVLKLEKNRIIPKQLAILNCVTAE